MDLITHFTAEYRDQWIATRLAAAEDYRFGTGSPLTAMIAAMAASARRISTRLESWARGSATADVPDYSPRIPSAH